MRVNKEVSLGAFANTLGDLASKKKHRPSSVYVPVERDPSLVPAPAISIWNQPTYKPAPAEYVRPGANDHLKFKSRGNRT